MLLGACSGSAPKNESPEPVCLTGKCDTPGNAANRECRDVANQGEQTFDECRTDRAALHCEQRRAEAIDSSQTAFTPSAIRWPCQDVPGTNTDPTDDRGQEYCEYFAVILPPPAEEGEPAEPVKLGAGGFGALGLDLNGDQIDALDEADLDGNPVVGQCVFTSWHVDVRKRLPVCERDSDCAEISFADDADLPLWAEEKSELGVKMNPQNLRMKVGFNSNGAAVDLVNRCLQDPPVPGESGEPEGFNLLRTEVDGELVTNEGQANYHRGCWKTFQLFTTEWRRSDPTICGAITRLAECGASVAGADTALQVAQALVPSPDNFRGFRLGTWDDENGLPDGCRYGTTGDDSHTLVLCDLKASDLLQAEAQADPKGTCRAKYARDVVVHIPLPAETLAAVSFDPDPNSPVTAACDGTPWIMQDDEAQISTPEEPVEEPRTEDPVEEPRTEDPVEEPRTEDPVEEPRQPRARQAGNACIDRLNDEGDLLLPDGNVCERQRTCNITDGKSEACGNGCIKPGGNCTKPVGCACNA